MKALSGQMCKEHSQVYADNTNNDHFMHMQLQQKENNRYPTKLSLDNDLRVRPDIIN